LYPRQLEPRVQKKSRDPDNSTTAHYLLVLKGAFVTKGIVLFGLAGHQTENNQKEFHFPLRLNNDLFLNFHGRHLRYDLSFLQTMDVTELPSVEASVERLRELLNRASKIKSKPDIEPPLPISEYSGEKGLPSEIENKSYAVIEVAARQLFLQFLTNSSSVDDAEFVHVWNLLDILNILGDQGTRTFLSMTYLPC